MTPDQMAELATQLRYAKNLLPTWLDEDEFHAYEEDIDRAADLIAGMAQRTNEQDILDVLDWENMRNGAIRALNPANQWAFDRLAQRVPLSDEQIADCATKIKPYPIELVQVPAEQLIAFIRAIEQAHGIRSDK